MTEQPTPSLETALYACECGKTLLAAPGRAECCIEAAAAAAEAAARDAVIVPVEQQFRVDVGGVEPGWMPTGFLMIVEYVDPDGIPGHAEVASHGCTEARRERLRAMLVREPRPPRPSRSKARKPGGGSR